MKFSNTELMTMAIGAGDKARYLSPPNPWVGALVVSVALLQVCLWAANVRTNVRAKWLMHATVMHIPLLLGLMVYDKIPR